jgi:hypothetical protein
MIQMCFEIFGVHRVRGRVVVHPKYVGGWSEERKFLGLGLEEV